MDFIAAAARFLLHVPRLGNGAGQNLDVVGRVPIVPRTPFNQMIVLDRLAPGKLGGEHTFGHLAYELTTLPRPAPATECQMTETVNKRKSSLRGTLSELQHQISFQKEKPDASVEESTVTVPQHQ